MKFLSIVIFISIFIVALIFSILNFHSVQIHFYFFTISMPLTLALTLELLAGIVIGVMVSGISSFKWKSQYAKLIKKMEKDQ